ncbi:MAG TPA: Xaa-Pro peptidase family protein [Candidatus Atribacteria bacterium]|nr:Xaa-Pro peptidase family protein [Candidatus Atribacteria bacterium]HPT77872.1 Xaa-Pro peptidase family protein [Candidatus Atribacteria bacterium]
MTSKLDKLRHLMMENSVDAVIVAEDRNRRYYSGYTGTDAYLLILADKSYLITDFRYVEQAKAQCPGYEVVEAYGKKAYEFIKQTCDKAGAKRVWFEDDTLTVKEYSEIKASLDPLELVPDTGRIAKPRILKTDDEVNNIRKAAQLADKGFSHILNFIRPGVTERDIALELEFFLRKNGSEGLAFPIIAASGPNGALPHAEPTDDKLAYGILLTLDFGCVINGYCSDMTRTVALGEPPEKLKVIYNIVLEAQEKALAFIKAGISGIEADKQAREHIIAHGYGDYFGHGLGHGVGLHIHEAPRLSPIGETILEPGMVVSVEPGIYLPGLGGVRIEDLVVITEDGYDNLVSSRKDLIIL